MVNKENIVDAVWEQSKLTKYQAHEFVNLVFDTIINSLKYGENVSVPGLGTWIIRHYAERIGHDAFRNRPLLIPPASRVLFRPAPGLRKL